MTLRQSTMRHARGRIAVGLCLTLAMLGCHVETITHGRQFTPDGRLRVSSLQPKCGCVSLKNTSGKRVSLESSFYGLALGSIVMERNEIIRILFDWAGPHNEDVYDIAAFDVNDAGQPQRDQQPPLRIQDALVEYAPMVDTPCNDKTCVFGPLAMNRVAEATESQERESSRRGVNFSSVIEASAPQDQCGCLMLRNFSDGAITLRSTLHGVETGQMDVPAGWTVPVPFDWAGPLDTDVYVVEGVNVRRMNQVIPRTAGSAATPAVPAAPATTNRSAMTIRLKDYLEIEGTLINMECKESYADFANDRHEAAALNVMCPWNPDGMPGLGMRAAFDQRTKNPQATNAAPNNAVPPLTARPQRPQAK